MKVNSRKTLVSCSEFLLGGDHGFDSIVHILDEVDFGTTKSTLVGDIKDTIVSLSVLSMSSSDVNIVLLGNSMELIWVLSEFWKLDVD